MILMGCQERDKMEMRRRERKQRMKQDKKDKTFVAFRIDPWQAGALSALAEEDNRSRNSLMRAIIADYIKSRLTKEQLTVFRQAVEGGGGDTAEG